MDADGSNVRTIAVKGSSTLPPAWSPDGSRIAFAFVDREGNSLDYTVRTVRPDGSDLVELGETLGNPA